MPDFSSRGGQAKPAASKIAAYSAASRARISFNRLRSEPSVRARVRKIETEVADGRITPSLAAEQIAELLQ